MNYNRVITKFYVVGGYRGMVEKFGKKITPFFDCYIDALTYQQCYRQFSESLSAGQIIREEFCL